MGRLLRQRGYRLHAPGSPEARALLAEQGLGRADLALALIGLEADDGDLVHHIVGLNEDGVFATRDPSDPEAPLLAIPWVRLHERLGRVPPGSTARFIREGLLPGEADRSTR